MRRGTPEVLVATLILLLLGSYVWYTQHVIVDLQADARRSSAMFARVFRAFGDPSGTEGALLDLSRLIQEQGVPVILTDPQGNPAGAGHANLPFDPTTRSRTTIHAFVPTSAFWQRNIRRSSIH